MPNEIQCPRCDSPLTDDELRSLRGKYHRRIGGQPPAPPRKLSDVDRAKIREAYADGMTVEELARGFGVSPRTVYRALEES